MCWYINLLISKSVTMHTQYSCISFAYLNKIKFIAGPFTEPIQLSIVSADFVPCVHFSDLPTRLSSNLSIINTKFSMAGLRNHKNEFIPFPIYAWLSVCALKYTQEVGTLFRKEVWLAVVFIDTIFIHLL